MDQNATAEYLKHADDLLRFASAVAGPSAADDIVATVVMRVLVESGDWRSIRNLRGYLVRSVMNEAIDRQRQSSRRRRREQRDSTHAPGTSFDEHVRTEVLDAVGRLTPRRARRGVPDLLARPIRQRGRQRARRVDPNRRTRTDRLPQRTGGVAAMTPAIDPLDTEIRRAMGELANAAPPTRPPESFDTDPLATEFEPLRTASASTTGESTGHRRRLLAVAATVIVAVAGVAVVVVNSDGDPTAISGVPTTPTAPNAPTTPENIPLADDALVSELADRRWVALERFDDPSPTARTPEFTVTSTPNGPAVAGFDGCNGYAGAFEFDGNSIVGGEITSETVGCDAETLGFGGSIELVPDTSTLVLAGEDGSPLARFHDLALLDAASADDMPYTFFVDGLEGVGFTVDGVGATPYTRSDGTTQPTASASNCWKPMPAI